MESDNTFLGKVIRVDSSIVEVEVSDDIPSTSPIINGRIYRIGQLGTFVKILIGNITLFGIVSSVSNTPVKDEESYVKQLYGSRYLAVQLVGEKVGNGRFEKGVGTYPTINDEVHLVIEKDLFEIYGFKEEGSIEIGKHASSDNLSIYVDIHKLVLRHLAILGSTGCGKSNTVVSIVKAIVSDYCGSRMVIVDPHGEYSSAFPEAKVFRINDSENPLYIPFWLMNFDELAFFLVGAKPIDDQKIEYRLFRELITSQKQMNCKLKSGDVNPNYITADSPVPFNIRNVWYNMNWWINATFKKANKEEQTEETAELVDKGDWRTLTPATFKPYSINNQAPYKSKNQEYYSYEKKILARLKDSRYDFLFNPGDYKDGNSCKDLHCLLNEWIGNEQRLTILDLSGVPYEVLDITVGLITRFIYDSMFWGRDESYTGRKRPLFIAFEEAHTYLGKNDDNNYSKVAVERIFKEGRKFGLGAIVISQRPSEISTTILAQVGTLIALRLTNGSDQATVKSSAPDNLTSLIDLLSSLRIGEAIILGESIEIPSRVRIALNDPRPTSEDPRLVEAWRKEFVFNEDNYKNVVTSIREKKRQ